MRGKKKSAPSPAAMRQRDLSDRRVGTSPRFTPAMLPTSVQKVKWLLEMKSDGHAEAFEERVGIGLDLDQRDAVGDRLRRFEAVAGDEQNHAVALPDLS